VNLIYWSVEATEYSITGLGRDFWRSPTEHVVILTLIPLFMMVGYLFREVEGRREMEAALNRLLKLSQEEISLEEMLKRTIDEIVSIPWLAMEAKGGIFLVEEEPDVLVLKAHRGLPKALQALCARVPFGRCLCGRAALSQQVVFAGQVDQRHENRYQGITPHGHYCLPILSAGRTLGTVVLYMEEGRTRNEKEETFLRSVANVLAGIIERKRAEEAVRQYARDLEDANAMKDLFIDIMRHDLLNPAGSVKSAADLLLGDVTKEERVELLRVVRDQISRLIDLIGSASKYSRLKETEGIEGGRQDLNTILRATVQDFRSQLQEAGMELRYLPDGEYPAWVDPIIGEVFSNLISNAIKYASQGKRIEVGILDQGDRWHVYVKDWGKGIRDEDKERLFTRFERLRKEGVKGTGLGLAIAKRIVDLHGGRIWVEDNPEGGSIFYVSLPKGKGS